MSQNIYFVAVELEEGSSLFEVFDYFLIDKDSEVDIRWSEKVKLNNYLLECTGMQNVTLNAFFDGEKFIPDLSNSLIDLSNVEDESKFIAMLAEDRVYGLFNVHKDSPKYIRYEMAMDSKVICIKNESDTFINLGHIWDGTKFLKAKEI